MQGKVEICGVNTSRLHVLSQVEMDALLRRAQAGDEDAREKLIEGNLRLVLSVIQRFDKRGENPDDLFQVGCIGLIKAISNFDPDKQVRFSTYGVPMIIGEIRRFLRDNNALRVSRSLRDTAYRAMQSREALEKQLGREPTMDAAYYPLATLIGDFQGGERGKIQLGAAWWFMDHRDGIKEQMRVLASTGGLGLFNGMLTDSRSFTSYARHDYFRRIFCSLVGEWVENGEYPDDKETLENLVKNVCIDNAKIYFGV